MEKDQAKAKQYVMELLNEYAKHDADFARDLKRKDKCIDMFLYLLMQKMVNDGAKGHSAAFGKDDVLIGQAVHYFHEDKCKVEDMFTDNMYMLNISNPEKSSAPSKPSTPATKKGKPSSKKSSSSSSSPLPSVDGRSSTSYNPDLDIDIDDIPSLSDLDIELD